MKTRNKFVEIVKLLLVGLLAASLGIFAVSTSINPASAVGVDSDVRIYADFETVEETEAMAAETNLEITAEGFALLKNQDNKALPFRSNIKDVSVFGVRSDTLDYGGGKGNNPYNTKIHTLVEGIEAGGYNVNPTLKNFYKDGENNYNSKSDEIPIENYDEQIMESYDIYDDAAIVVLSRSCGEGKDLSRNTGEKIDESDRSFQHKNLAEDDAGNTYRHDLMLTATEEDLIKHVTDNFDKVIVLINSTNAMELGTLEDNEAIDAILWIAIPGQNGTLTVGNVLNGSINPSGRIVNTYVRDLTDDPTWQNFGDNTQTGSSYSYLKEDGTTWGYNGIEYEEGIYQGYKYYETAAYEASQGNYEGFDYDKAVLYPLGYGLSYTTFEQEIVSTTPEANEALTADGTITVDVKVTNTGKVAGKEVVQLYYTPEYYAYSGADTDTLEKSYINLVKYGKTDLLLPGESEIVSLTFDVRNMASFDYDDANENDFVGYELEKGTYTVKLMKNAHEVIGSVDYTVPEAEAGELTGFTYATDEVSGKEIEAVFSQDDIFNSISDTMTIMSRTDFADTYPEAPTKAELTKTEDFFEWAVKETNFTYADDKVTDPWYVAEVPEGWSQQTADNRDIDTMIGEMMGVALFDPADGNYGDVSDEWQEFLNQLTWEEIKNICGTGQFGLAGVDSIGAIASSGADSPVAMGRGFQWCSNPVVSATWNLDLAEKQGRIVGNEGLFFDTEVWEGPGANIHRSAFSGRNYEYYSEDGVLSGYACAAVVKGATEKGMVCDIKHFALNDQETGRSGLFTYADEQTIREIYLKGFEYGVKIGGALGTMTAYSRIGQVKAAGNWALTYAIFNEWGFLGSATTDAYGPRTIGEKPVADIMIRAGQHRSFSQNVYPTGDWDATKNNVVYTTETGVVESATQYVSARYCAMHCLYAIANSAAGKNGVVVSKFEGKTLEAAEQGTAYNASVAASASAIGSDDVIYSISSGTLPNGLTLAEDGTLSGTPTEDGTFTFTVGCVVDGWISGSAAMSLTVGSAFEWSATANAKVGEAYTNTISSDTINSTTYTNGVVYSVSSGELPAGLTLDSTTGTISGTPTVAGTSTIVIEADGSIVSGRTEVHSYFYTTVTITVDESNVEPEPAVSFRVHDGKVQTKLSGETEWTDLIAISELTGAAGEDGNGIKSIAKTATEENVDTYTITYTDNTTTTFTVTNAPIPEEGCNGSVGSTIIVVMGLLAAACVVLVIRRIKASK